MYAKHQTFIQNYGAKSPENMARVLRFVVITIQNRLFNCTADMESVDSALAGIGDFEIATGILYGHKRAAVDYIESEKERLFNLARLAYDSPESERSKSESLLALFCEIPGLGFVKAGFAVQLLFGLVGCLDSHNLERFGINPNKVRSSRFKNAKRPAQKRKVLNEYLDYCENLGGAAGLWDSWCQHLSTRKDETGVKMNHNRPLYDSAEHVSALHCIALGLSPETGALESA